MVLLLESFLLVCVAMEDLRVSFAVLYGKCTKALMLKHAKVYRRLFVVQKFRASTEVAIDSPVSVKKDFEKR